MCKQIINFVLGLLVVILATCSYSLYGQQSVQSILQPAFQAQPSLPQPYNLVLRTAASLPFQADQLQTKQTYPIQLVGELGVVELVRNENYPIDSEKAPFPNLLTPATSSSIVWIFDKLDDPTRANNFTSSIDSNRQAVYFSSTEESYFKVSVVYQVSTIPNQTCDISTGDCLTSSPITDNYLTSLIFVTRKDIPHPEPPTPQPSPNPSPNPQPSPTNIATLYNQYDTGQFGLPALTQSDKRAVDAVTTAYVIGSNQPFTQVVSGWNMEVYYYVRSASEGTSDSYAKLMQSFSDQFIVTVSTTADFERNIRELGAANSRSYKGVTSLPSTDSEASESIEATGSPDLPEVNELAESSQESITGQPGRPATLQRRR